MEVIVTDLRSATIIYWNRLPALSSLGILEPRIVVNHRHISLISDNEEIGKDDTARSLKLYDITSVSLRKNKISLPSPLSMLNSDKLQSDRKKPVNHFSSTKYIKGKIEVPRYIQHSKS